MRDRRGRGRLFLALVEGVKLAGRAQDEDAVDAFRQHVVDVRTQSRQVELVIGRQRRHHRGDDTLQHDSILWIDPPAFFYFVPYLIICILMADCAQLP